MVKAVGDADGTVDRIGVLTGAARASWFTFLGTLVFVTVSLIGVRDADFFASERTVDLPLVGVSVPVTLFFLFAAILVAVIHGYLQVLLEEMWTLLGRAPARLADGRALSSAITPWLVTSFGLHLRAWLRREDPAPIASSMLGRSGAAASCALLFIAAPVLLFALWLLSQPAHLAWLTLSIGMLAWAATLMSALGFSTLVKCLRGHSQSVRMGHALAAALCLGVVVAVSLSRTVWDPQGALVTRNPREPTIVTTVTNWLRPAVADLRGIRLTEMTAGWLPHQDAVDAFARDWCALRDDPVTCWERGLEDERFRNAYFAHRARWMAVQDKPSLDGRHMDHADLVSAFLPGVSLTGARLVRADLQGARIEGVRALRADMTAAVLLDAHASTAFFRHSVLDGANMRSLSAIGADFGGARLHRVDLSEAVVDHALFNLADLSGASMSLASLRFARFHRATLRRVALDNARLQGAQLVQTDLSGARLEGTRIGPATLSSIDFSGAWLSWLLLENRSDFWFGRSDFTGTQLWGVALRNLDMRHSTLDGPEQLAHVFADGSVVLPDGMPRPCHWTDDTLGDRAFHSRWRGMIEVMPVQRSWSTFAPEPWVEVDPTPPAAGCPMREMSLQAQTDWMRAFIDARGAMELN